MLDNAWQRTMHQMHQTLVPVARLFSTRSPIEHHHQQWSTIKEIQMSSLPEVNIWISLYELRNQMVHACVSGLSVHHFGL